MRYKSTRKYERITGTCVSVGLLLGMLFFQACAPPPPPKEVPLVRNDPFRAVPDRFTVKARKSEKARDIPRAILCWRIVQAFTPGVRLADAEIQRLSSMARSEAQRHYALGRKYLQDNKTALAREEFLRAIFFDRDNQKSLEALRGTRSPSEAVSYRLKAGDTARSIARAVYHDPEKAFLVAYFSNVGTWDSPKPGEIISLPVIESPPPVKKQSRAMTSVQKARELFQKKKYREAISLAEDIVAYGPSPAARDIINGSYYALALRELESNRVLAAKKLFLMVDRNYKSTGDYIRKITNQLRVRADYHYRKGAQYFVSEKLEKAISEWETALRLNPDHGKARADLRKARTMLKNLNRLQ